MDASLLIDVTRLLSRASSGLLPTGVDRVCLAYVAHYGPRAQAVVQWKGWRRIFPFKESQELFLLLLDGAPRFRGDAARIILRACLPPWPSQDGRKRIYFNLGHTGVDDPGLASWLRRTRQRPVYLVHDLIPLTHPEYCREGEALRHSARLEMLLRTGTGVLTNSESTLDDLRQFAQRHALPTPPALAAPLAPARLEFDPSLPPPLEAPYFVVLGTIEPRKNHLLLLHAWRRMIAESGNQAPHLVVVGRRGWECENVVDLLERCELLRGFVHEIPGCSDTELAGYLRHARALLFPSFTEGYGLPLGEALMLGTPVIASALPVFRETADDVPEYMDPLDGPAWIGAIRDYATAGSARRAAQLERLAGFRAPTWDEHFKRVDSFLETLG